MHRQGAGSVLRNTAAPLRSNPSIFLVTTNAAESRGRLIICDHHTLILRPKQIGVVQLAIFRTPMLLRTQTGWGQPTYHDEVRESVLYVER